MSRVRLEPTSIRPGVGYLLTAFALAVTLAAPAEATLRKCDNSDRTANSGVRETPRLVNGVYVRDPEPEPPLLMVDGVIGGQPSGGSGGYSYVTASGERITIPQDQLLFIRILCLEEEVDGQIVKRDAVSIGTRAGAEGMMRLYLADLARLQEAYRRANGQYATALDYVGFPRTHHPLPIELKAVDGGWSAVATSGGKSCRVTIGNASAGETAPGVVECTDSPEPSDSPST